MDHWFKAKKSQGLKVNSKPCFSWSEGQSHESGKISSGTWPSSLNVSSSTRYDICLHGTVDYRSRTHILSDNMSVHSWHPYSIQIISASQDKNNSIDKKLEPCQMMWCQIKLR